MSQRVGTVPRDCDLVERPFALPASSVEFTIDLPVPPSVNKLRRITQAGRKKLKKYYADADIHVLKEWRDRHENGERFRLPIRKLVGAFEAVISIGDESCKTDADNLAKTILDFAVSRQFVTDDSPKFMRRLIIEYRDDMRGCRLTLRSLHG